MALHLPDPSELIPLEPSQAVILLLGDMELLLGVTLCWNAFLVTTTPEREKLYKQTAMLDSAKAVLETALCEDFRKIVVRRMVWDAQIAAAIAKCNPVVAGGHTTKKVSYSDPYAPANDDSFLSDIRGTSYRKKQKRRKGSFSDDSESSDDTRSCNTSPKSVLSDDDDLTALKHKAPDANLVSKNPLAIMPNPNPMTPLPQQNLGSATFAALGRHLPTSFPFGANDFVGIENQANTCYLTAALQVLFHIPYFRQCMYNVVVEGLRRKDVVQALQSLLGGLQMKCEGVTTVPLTNAFRWSADDVRHQHDVHEMLLILFDYIEKQISPQAVLERTTSPSNSTSEVPSVDAAKKTNTAGNEDAHSVDDHHEPSTPTATTSTTVPQNNFVQKLFRGEQMYYTSVPEAQYESRQAEPFLVVEVPVQNLDSLDASLEEISRPTTIDGFMVEHPDGTKTSHTAERSLRFSQLPPVLLIHPNRVVFDFEKLAQVTVNNRWTFPVHLDLTPFTRLRRSASPSQDLSNTDGLTPPRTREDPHPGSQWEEDDDDEGSPAPVQFDSPNKLVPGAAEGEVEQMTREGSLFQRSDVHAMSEYELRTVVLHSGNAASGHYVACVRSNGFWTCFNDERVYSITESEVLRRAFGGPTASFDRVERAKLLVYVRKSSAMRLLSEVPIPDRIRLATSEHEKKLTLEFRVTCEAFANGLGGKHLELVAKSVQRVEIHAAASMEELYSCIGNKLKVSSDRVVIWKYGYHYVEQMMDKALKCVTKDDLTLARYITVEVLPLDAAGGRDAVVTMYPLRSWAPNGTLPYIGNARSTSHAVDLARAAFDGASHPPPEADARSSFVTPTASTEEGQGTPPEDAGEDANCSTDDKAAPASTAEEWNVYSYYGSNPTLRLMTPTATLINGVCLIAAPASVTLSQIRDVLNARPVTITFSLIKPTNCDDCTDLWDETVDENMTYTDLQKVVFNRLQTTSTMMLTPEEEAFLGPDNLTSPQRLGFYRHHIDTCGPSRVLQLPFHKNTVYDTHVRDLLKSGSVGFNTSTDSNAIRVRHVYVSVVPEDMPPPGEWYNMQYFVFATGLERKIVSYAHLYRNSTVGDYLTTLHRQASLRLVELKDVPLTRLRILGLDWRGKIVKQFVHHAQVLRGTDIDNYSVDVYVPHPSFPVVPNPPLMNQSTNDDTEIELDSDVESPVTTPAEIKTDHDSNKEALDGDAGDVVAAPIPLWESIDLYHIVQYGDLEDYIAPPTNISLNIADLSRVTGEVIMDAALEASRLDPNSSRYNSIKLLGQVVLRGAYIADSVRLGYDQGITEEVLRDVGFKVRCILIDQTECMLASASAGGGSLTPSPGRTPVKPMTKQRAPEAVIRIADE